MILKDITVMIVVKFPELEISDELDLPQARHAIYSRAEQKAYEKEEDNIQIVECSNYPAIIT